MTCSDVQRLLPEMFDGDADEALPPAVEIHLQSCLECSDLVSDLRVITTGARELAATDEPSPRVWARIAAELRAEGLIREPEPVAVRPVLVPSKSPRRWNSWWLAPVMASLLVVGSYVVS
ncbi:MAG: anti-sigma factor, partial [Terriglobales bacterium]